MDKNTYKCYLRLIRKGYLYDIKNDNDSHFKGYLVGYNIYNNNFLFQCIDRGWYRSNIQQLTDNGYIIAKTIKMPLKNLWNVEINSSLLRELFKQQLSHN